MPQITERAGLTTRTFYRHFADTREAPFEPADGQPPVEEVLEQVPPGLDSAAFIAWGLRRVPGRFEGHSGQWRAILKVVDSDASLQERDLTSSGRACSPRR